VHFCGLDRGVSAFLINASSLALNLLAIRPLDGGQLLLAVRLRLARAR
jgi:Zn-dependent protease